MSGGSFHKPPFVDAPVFKPGSLSRQGNTERLLGRLGYRVARQTGSHMRLARTAEGEHRITIPRHGTLKVGTLNSILKDVAEHLKMSKEELIRELWGER